MVDDWVTTSKDQHPSDFTEVQPHYNELMRVIKIFLGRPLPVVGLVIIVALIIIAIFAPWIAPHDPYKMDLGNILLPPSSEHLLGTDPLGRDTLSRIIYGSRTSLLVGLGATSASGVVGIFLGLLAAYSGGKLFHVIMRFMDALMSIPMIILALIISSMLGGGVKNVIIALAVSMIPAPCRLICGVALSVKQNEYVLAARSIGMDTPGIMFTQIFPNSFPPVLVLVTVGLGATILAEAGLSFLGVGITPPTAAWGSMINEGYQYLVTNPVLALSPGVAIMLVVFGFNMVGDGLRDALDPRLRGAF